MAWIPIISTDLPFLTSKSEPAILSMALWNASSINMESHNITSNQGTYFIIVMFRYGAITMVESDTTLSGSSQIHRVLKWHIEA